MKNSQKLYGAVIVAIAISFVVIYTQNWDNNNQYTNGISGNPVRLDGGGQQTNKQTQQEHNQCVGSGPSAVCSRVAGGGSDLCQANQDCICPSNVCQQNCNTLQPPTVYLSDVCGPCSDASDCVGHNSGDTCYVRIADGSNSGQGKNIRGKCKAGDGCHQTGQGYNSRCGKKCSCDALIPPMQRTE